MFGHLGCYCEAISIVPLGHYVMRWGEDIAVIIPQGNESGRYGRGRRWRRRRRPGGQVRMNDKLQDTHRGGEVRKKRHGDGQKLAGEGG